jgi:hypothetical protein
MKTENSHKMMRIAVFVLSLAVGSGGRMAAANERPVADAGSSRYAGAKPIQLDGTRSHDPDASGGLSFAWRQVSGPPVLITGADTATPLIGGSSLTDKQGNEILDAFVQTDAVQECEFELVVSDGVLTSAPDTVKVIIVPDFGPVTLALANPPFRPDRPTVISFGGGDCFTGHSLPEYWVEWQKSANWLSAPSYGPDTSSPDPWRTYYRYGDMAIAYLSREAPEYSGMIQTVGFSTGGQPAVDTAIRMNRYRDPRYAVNHVTELDSNCRGPRGSGASLASSELLRGSAVDGEPLWHELYWGEAHPFSNPPRDLVGIYLEGKDHAGAALWYIGSPGDVAANEFNHGVVAGAFWSVVGPGKNLQPSADAIGYWFHRTPEGTMVLFDESTYPGRFPEPVQLLTRDETPGSDGTIASAVLSCRESENATRYQLLFGRDADHMVYLAADTAAPPSERVSVFPFETTWWTVKAHDPYGATIYADPASLKAQNVLPQLVQNGRTGRTYASIQEAINRSRDGDEIVLGAGIWPYLENLDFKGKSLTLRSADPNDPVIVATTVITGQGGTPALTLSGQDRTRPLLAGLTIRSETVGVSCRNTLATIRNCVVQCPNGIAVEFWYGRAPQLIDCTILGQVREGDDPSLVAYWKLDETEGATAHDSAANNDATVTGLPAWQPDGGAVGGALEFNGSTFLVSHLIPKPLEGPFTALAWVKGGASGQAILSQQSGVNWLMADSATGVLRTEVSQTTRAGLGLSSSAVITDGDWHRVALVWDGTNRRLYVDGVLAAEDTQKALAPGYGKLVIGAGSNLSAGSFWSGLIDDVRIYNQAVKP